MTPGRVRRVVVADKVETIRRMLDGIGTLPLADLAAFREDPRMVAAGDSFLRRALEALLDLGRHILAKGFGRAPAEYTEVARQLEETGVLDPTLAARLALMARYRNRMVHFYDEVGDEELFGVLTTGPADVRNVLSALVAWVGANPEKADP